MYDLLYGLASQSESGLTLSQQGNTILRERALIRDRTRTPILNSSSDFQFDAIGARDGPYPWPPSFNQLSPEEAQLHQCLLGLVTQTPLLHHSDLLMPMISKVSWIDIC